MAQTSLLWKKNQYCLVVVLLLSGAVSGTSHDPGVPSKGYVYTAPVVPVPNAAPAVALPLPVPAAATSSARGYLTAFPDGYSFVYAVQHPDAESSSHVEVTRSSGGRALAPLPSAPIPAAFPGASIPTAFSAASIPTAFSAAPAAYSATPFPWTLPSPFPGAAAFPSTLPSPFRGAFPAVTLPPTPLPASARYAPTYAYDVGAVGTASAPGPVLLASHYGAAPVPSLPQPYGAYPGGPFYTYYTK